MGECSLCDRYECLPNKMQGMHRSNECMQTGDAKLRSELQQLERSPLSGTGKDLRKSCFSGGIGW